MLIYFCLKIQYFTEPFLRKWWVLIVLIGNWCKKKTIFYNQIDLLNSGMVNVFEN